MGNLSISSSGTSTYLSAVLFFFVIFFSFFFPFIRSKREDGDQRRVEKRVHELRQPGEERCQSPRTRQQELDQNGQGLRALQQNLHLHRRRHHLPEVLRQQGQTYHLRSLLEIHRRTRAQVLRR